MRAQHGSTDESATDQLVRLLVTHSSAAIGIKSPDGEYLFANDRLRELAGQAAGASDGLADTDLFKRDQARLVGEQTDRLLADRDLQMTTATLPVGRDGRTHEFLQFPITSSHGRIFAIGVMALECPKDRVSDRAERALEHSNKVNAELRRLVEDLEVYAHTDRLTGAWNRRWLEEAVLNELSRFERYGHPVSIIILDIDHFKRINDEHGHLTGDQVLQEVAARVRATDRGSDSLVRWGGEEFIVLSPNTPLVAAGRLAERLRVAISAEPIDAVGTVTCSFGVAEYGEGETWKEWLERADQALYAAKNGGRDRVELDSAGEQTARATDRTAPGFLQLVWRKAYNSDHPVIDEQHRQLFFLANELLGAVLDSRSRESVERIALNLVRALEDHFAAEEGIIRAAGYPGSEAHAEVHRDLLARTQAVLERFHDDSLGLGDLFHFLGYDLVTKHLLNADREFFDYV